MLPLLRSELFRLNRRWMPRVLILTVVAAVVLFYAIVWLVLVSTENAQDAADIRDDLALAAARETGLGLAGFFASIVAVIMAASIVGTEYGWGTIRALLPRARGRVRLLLAKLVALAVFDLVLIAAAFLTALAMTGLVTLAEDLSTDPGGDFLVEALAAMARSTYVLFPYSALAFVVAVVTRSNAAGIAIGLAVLLAESIVLGIVTALTDAVDWLGDALFTQNSAAITALNGGAADRDLPDPWVATLVLGLWTVAFAAVAIAVFRRRDVTSGA